MKQKLRALKKQFMFVMNVQQGELITNDKFVQLERFMRKLGLRGLWTELEDVNCECDKKGER